MFSSLASPTSLGKLDLNLSLEPSPGYSFQESFTYARSKADGVGPTVSPDRGKYNEERVTPPFAPLFFTAKVESSLELPIRSARRGIFVMHLMDVGMPITIVISTNPNGPPS